MKTTFKQIGSVLLAMAMILVLHPSIAHAESVEEDELQIQDIEVSIDQLSDGVTVLLTRNEDGTFDQTVFYDDVVFSEDIIADNVNQTRATADGVLEWATFHVGFNNWNNDTGRLYYTVSADEPMYNITGSAYVKSTSILFPTTYYSSSFSSLLYGYTTASRVLDDDVDTGDEDKVRVGFSSVTMNTVAGETAYFGSGSQVVER